jgi:hypothetical protein
LTNIARSTQMIKLIKQIFSPHLFTFWLDMGGEKPAPTSQTVTQTSIPEYARPYVEKMLGKAEALTSSPYQAYGGQRIAEFSPMQQQAFQGVQNLQPAQQLGTATQMAGLAGLGSLQAGGQYARQATDPNAMQAYMSPYIQGALAPQLEEARRQAGITGQQEASRAVQSGAFGGARHGIVEAENARNLANLQADIYGKGMQNAFQSAQQAQQFGSTLGLQGLGQAGQMAGQLGQLGSTQFGQQKDVLNALSAAGTQQQGLQQQQLGQQYQDFVAQREYPKEGLSYMSNLLRGLPLSQSSYSMYEAPASPLAQAAGLGMTAYGASQGKFFKAGGLAQLAVDHLNRG